MFSCSRAFLSVVNLGQIVNFMVWVPVCVSTCASVTDLHPESGSAVCLASIRGSVFLNASVKGELTCSGTFPPAHYNTRPLSWNSMFVHARVFILTCARTYECAQVNYSSSESPFFISFFFFLLCALLTFLSSLSRTMVWPQPFPLASALPSNSQHIVSIEHAFMGEKIYRYWRKTLVKTTGSKDVLLH